MSVLPGAPQAAETAPAPSGIQWRLRNVALFFAGPFITIGHLAMMPFVLPGVLKSLREEASKDTQHS
jgi:hypothetical protein